MGEDGRGVSSGVKRTASEIQTPVTVRATLHSREAMVQRWDRVQEGAAAETDSSVSPAGVEAVEETCEQNERKEIVRWRKKRKCREIDAQHAGGDRKKVSYF